MAEYIEREALKKSFCEWCNKEYEDEPCEPNECPLQTIILNTPAADVVEVVRCKDCIHSELNEADEDYRNCISYFGCANPKDYFCADGKRKVDNGR